MRRYRLVIEGRGRKEFARLDAATRGRFYEAFHELEIDPFRARPGCDIRRLGGREGAWAVRVGSYRGVYAVDGDTIRFTTFRSGHRAYA